MSSPSRRLIILGCTGSIGTSALDVVRHLRTSGGQGELEIVGLAAGSNATVLQQQADEQRVAHVAIADASKAASLNAAHVYAGPDAALELIHAVAQPGDMVLGAMVGSAGVPATLAAIERGCDIALANKETLVAAGDLVMPAVRERDVTLLPVDSEHSAIFQCLRAGRSMDEVRRLVLTASGGPFRTWTHERIQNATVEEALNHPTWSMGPKVTVDSASLMNKALEVIEAHWLFGLPAEKIEVILHPQSMIHSFVEFVDGSIIAQLGPPDMRTPIQYALTWPHRVDGCSARLDWTQLRQMDFEPPDHDRFPALAMAYDVIRAGGTAGAIFNAANEVAVESFLAGEIPFGRIAWAVGRTLRRLDVAPVTSLADVMAADAAARDEVRGHLTADRVESRV